MKKNGLILLSCIVASTLVFTARNVLGCCGGPLEGTNGITFQVEGVKTIEDADKIESALKQSPGVMEVHVYREKNEVSVTLSSSSIPEESLIQCVERTGFSAFLPTNINLNICSIEDNSSTESLRKSLTDLPGIMVRNVDFEHKLISIDIYKPWVKTAKQMISVIEDNGCKLCLPKETLIFKTAGMNAVDAFNARAYLQLLFGVVSADLSPDEGSLKVVIYKEFASVDDIVRTVKERGFIDVEIILNPI